MAYIGKSIESGTFAVLDTSGNTYNGSNTTFSLGTQVGSPAQLLVSLGQVAGEQELHQGTCGCRGRCGGT